MKQPEEGLEDEKGTFIERGTWKEGEKPSEFVKKPFNILSLEEIRAKGVKRTLIYKNSLR